MGWELLQLVVNGLVTGSVYALGAVGISLVFGPLRIVNFAQGDYLTFGAYMALIANVGWGVNIVLAAVFAMIMTAVLAVAIEFALWRPMRHRGAKTMSLFICSIGLAFILRSAILFAAGGGERTYNVNVFQVYSIGQIRISETQLISIAVAMAAIVATAVVLAKTAFGRQVRAVADSVELASIAGVNVDRMVISIWILVGMLAGLCGVLAGLIQSSFDPNLGWNLLLPLFAAVIIGGVGSPYGALLGGLTLGIVQEVSTWSGFFGGLNPVWKPAIAFGVLVAVLMVRPQGLLGRARTL
jgi:branched-subunit amino acid ABC-type transport system permease component